MDKQPHPLLTLPSAIIIAGVIIAVAIIWTQGSRQPIADTDPAPKPVQISYTAITKDDHILGNPNAIVKILEYSDPSCPYCKTFNPTMEKIMAEYGPDGKVAWVYRAFPLDKPAPNGSVLHPNAGHQSQAIECAASIGGNEKFWNYEKAWYETFPLQGATGRSLSDDSKQLIEIAKTVGLDSVAFNECLTSGSTKDKIEKQYLAGINDGVSGTPHSIIYTSTGKRIPIQGGAIPYESLKPLIDAAIKEIK